MLSASKALGLIPSLGRPQQQFDHLIRKTGKPFLGLRNAMILWRRQQDSGRKNGIVIGKREVVNVNACQTGWRIWDALERLGVHSSLPE